ncbi:MAG: hypothetical protein M3P70_18590 [Actinomycetota bacterium]|nr:hypothetical protein [Actinomycetota bacterium]
MRSIFAVGVGMLLALLIALLVVGGILAPVLSAVFGLEVDKARAVPVILPLLLFVAAFSFYFGGMIAAFKAPARRRLHGVLVVPAALVLSAGLNLGSGEGPLPGLDDARGVVLTVLFLLVSVAASFVGGHRGDALYVQTQMAASRRRR